MHRLCAILLLISLTSPATALDELVDSDWLKDNRVAKDIVLLDIQQQEHYRRFHIPGSINAPYRSWRTDKKSQAPGMLPPINRMERFLGKLGIGNDSAIVIIATGSRPSDMAAASRVFWSLKMMGHRKVGVLNGGLVDYTKRFARDLEVLPRYKNATSYKAEPVNSITATDSAIESALLSDAQLLDARTLGEYVGVITAKPAERPGTIPGSRHLPFDWLVNAEGYIRGKKEVTTLFKSAGLKPDQDGTIHFCHSGNRAALTWFADYAILGNRNAKLYDASMREWATRKSLPMETRITFEPAPNDH